MSPEPTQTELDPAGVLLAEAVEAGCNWPDLAWEELGELNDRELRQFYGRVYPGMAGWRAWVGFPWKP